MPASTSPAMAPPMMPAIIQMKSSASSANSVCARAAAARATSWACAGAASVGSPGRAGLALAPRDLDQRRRCEPAESDDCPHLAGTEQVTGAALDEVGLASAKPSWLAATSATSRASSDRPTSLAHRKQIPGPAPPPHPTAQLVKLRDAEAIRLLDDHDGRVRRRRCPARRPWSRPGPRRPAGERAQRLLLRLGGQRPVQQADARRAELAQQTRVLRDGRDRIVAAGDLAHRAHDEHLAARGNRLARALGGAPFAGAPAAPRPPPARAPWQFGQERSVQIAVQRQRQANGVADIDSRWATPAGC